MVRTRNRRIGDGSCDRGRGELADLEGHEEQDAVQRIVSTIDVIAKEKIVMKRGLSADFEQLQEVEELTVHCSKEVQVAASNGAGDSPRYYLEKIKKRKGRAVSLNCGNEAPSMQNLAAQLVPFSPKILATQLVPFSPKNRTISDNDDRRLHGLNILLPLKNFFCHLA